MYSWQQYRSDFRPGQIIKILRSFIKTSHPILSKISSGWCAIWIMIAGRKRSWLGVSQPLQSMHPKPKLNDGMPLLMGWGNGKAYWWVVDLWKRIDVKYAKESHIIVFFFFSLFPHIYWDEIWMRRESTFKNPTQGDVEGRCTASIVWISCQYLDIFCLLLIFPTARHVLPVVVGRKSPNCPWICTHQH